MANDAARKSCREMAQTVPYPTVVATLGNGMPPVSHIILIGIYAAISVGAGFLAPILADSPPVLTGALVFVICALAHEVWTRRSNEARLIRSIRIMKSAYDRLQADRPGPPGGPSLPDGDTATPATAPPVHAPSGEDPNGPTAEKPAPSIPSAAPMAPQGTAEERTEASDLAVLQRLLNALQAGGDPGLRPEPGIEDSGNAQASENGALRVVGGTAGGNDETQDTLRLLEQGLREDRVDLYLQPIVSLPQRKRRYFECYSRVRTPDGEVIDPQDYLDLAQQAGMLGAIDNILFFRCLQLLGKLRRHDPAAVFFCNISANTLADSGFVRDVIAYMERHRDLSAKLVLEIGQAELAAAPEDLPDYLVALQAAGYRFSMDGVKDLDIDIPVMSEAGFRSVKLDAGLLLDLIEAGRGSLIRSLKQNLDHHGIDMIVERIETEKDLLDLLDYNIDYGQGFLFGEPRPSKDPGAKTAADGAG